MELPYGEPLTLEEAQVFAMSRKGRQTFNGLMRMHGSIEGKAYTTELLIAEGEVVALELSIEGAEPVYKEAAFEQIKNLAGSEGDLKILRFHQEDMHMTLSSNSKAVLENRIPLETFKIRIKTAPAESQQTEDEGKAGSQDRPGGQLPEQPFEENKAFDTMKKSLGIKEVPLKQKGGFFDAMRSMLGTSGPKPRPEFRGRFRLEPAAQPPQSNPKQDLIARIKERRFGMLTEKLLQKRAEQKVQEASKTEGVMVETTIDKLFNLVDKRDKVKINDALAHEIGISKEKLEEWAVILEEHNLVTINYHTIGEPEITKKQKK
ncbi:MAG: hypothetical protein PHG85_00490 [Candidatus Altiarchaeota archaeon]|nr:hypothetical protein [Candidatus Altiarchaeota archaeon]